MGIINIRRQGLGKDNHVHQVSLNYIEDELVQEDIFQLGGDHDNDLDYSNLSDVGCEYALVNDHISNIPYELYELPNLKNVLCLETWNMCLTEEERFNLAAYLPDMDQETFELTMIELLKGDNLYFGSPLELLFCRLKGGFYYPQVAGLREGLKFLQEQRYYHYLRSYHESMDQKFLAMRKAWSNSQPNTSTEEHIEIWKNKNNHRPIFPVDLNAFPLVDELPSKGDKKVTWLPPQRMTRFINEDVSSHVSSMDLSSTSFNSRRKANGVLKLKLPDFSSVPKQLVLTLPSETWEPIRRPPRGILKLKPQGRPSSLVERPRQIAVPRSKDLCSVFDTHTSKVSSSHSASQCQVRNITNKLNGVNQLVGNHSVYRGSTISELDGLNVARLSDNRGSSLRKIKIAKGMKMSSTDSSGLGDYFDSQQKGALMTSFGLHQSSQDNNRRELIPLQSNVSEALSRDLIITNDYEVFPTSPPHSEYQSRDKDGEGIEKNFRFPITYKRKKPHTRISALQNHIKSSIVASIAPEVPAGTNFNLVEKTRAIRIRVKGWNEYSSQQKQGVLDGQHLDSPSIQMMTLCVQNDDKLDG